MIICSYIFSILLYTTESFTNDELKSDKSLSNNDDNRNDKGDLLTECAKEWSLECTKVSLISDLQQILRKNSYKIFSGLELKRKEAIEDEKRTDGGPTTKAPEEEEMELNLPRQQHEEYKSLNEMIISRVDKILQSFYLNVNMYPGIDMQVGLSDDGNNVNFALAKGADEGRDITEGRGKKGKGSNMLHVLAGLAVIPVSLVVLFLLVLKAIVLGKLSLILTALYMLKNTSGQPSIKRNHVHYHPHYHDYHDVYSAEDSRHTPVYSSGPHAYHDSMGSSDVQHVAFTAHVPQGE